MIRIFVANLNYSTDENAIREVFGVFGRVREVRLIRDWQSGRSKGYGFVDMYEREEGAQAIRGLGGKALDDRVIDVREAEQQPGERPSVRDMLSRVRDFLDELGEGEGENARRATDLGDEIHEFLERPQPAKRSPQQTQKVWSNEDPY